MVMAMNAGSIQVLPMDKIASAYPPKSPSANRGLFSKGTLSVPVSSYPGGGHTILGRFERVKVEGRKGRGYWEWKSAEMRRERSGNEGDDELTSLESDTVLRRSSDHILKDKCLLPSTFQEKYLDNPQVQTTYPLLPQSGKIESNISGGVRVLPPFLPYERVYNENPCRHLGLNPPESTSSKPHSARAHDFAQHPIETSTTQLHDDPQTQPSYQVNPYHRSFAGSSSITPAGYIPSAPPREVVYADAVNKRERSTLAEGTDSQSVGCLYPSEHNRENKSAVNETKYTNNDIKASYNIKEDLNLNSNKDTNIQIQYYQNSKYDEFKQKPIRNTNIASDKNVIDIKKDKNGENAIGKPPIYLIQDSRSKNNSNIYPEKSLNKNKEYESNISLQKTVENRPKKDEDKIKHLHYPTSEASKPGVLLGEKSNSLVCLRDPISRNKKDNPSRRSGALVWVNQPGGGAKLEWIPTPGLATIRAVTENPPTYGKSRVTQSQLKGGSLRHVVAGSNLNPQKSAPKGIIKRGDEGGGRGGGGRGAERGRECDMKGVEARDGGNNMARAVSNNSRAVGAGRETSVDVHSHSENWQQYSPQSDTNKCGVPNNIKEHTEVKNFESGSPKNVLSSAPGITRPVGRTPIIQTGSGENKSPERGSEAKDKIVTVAGRSQGQTVRIRIRPEVHAYLSNLPVIQGELHPQSPSITARRDSLRSANSSSASGLTLGSGEGSIGYQEEDYEAVVDEYTLLKKAVDDHDPEALRLLTATEAALHSEGGSGYPYLREMKERLLMSNDDPTMQSSPHNNDHDNQLIEVHQTPVGTVVKLNPDGNGAHTSRTPRVESYYTGTLESRKTNFREFVPKNAKTSSFITLSLLYATLLVVVCLGFVLSEVLTHNVPLYYYEAFFTYLYGLSIFFLLYIFCYLLTGGGSTKEKSSSKNQKVRKPEVLPTDGGSPTQEKLTEPKAKPPKKQKTSDNDHSHGSFFLRIGAIAFGLGTMIYNGLEFGVFFELPMTSPCFQILRGVNPLAQLVFTFMQMYFIFMNARLNIHKFKFLARFGLMHIVATNICVWIRTLVRESLKEINEFRVTQGKAGEDFMIMEGIRRALQNRGLLAPNRYMYNLGVYPEFRDASKDNETLPEPTPTEDDYDANSYDDFGFGLMTTTNTMATSTGPAEVWDNEDVVNRTCERMEIMGSIVSDSAPYLYPFIVEYSLIASAVVFIMWKHIGRNPKFIYDPESATDHMSVGSRRCYQKVDCIGASKGLFCGLLMLVATLICLILFFVLIHRDELRMLAIYLADVSHCGIMLLSIVAIFVGFCRVRHLKFFGEREEELDDILLMVSAFGLFAYATFSAVAGSLSAFTEEPNILVMVTSMLSVIQVMIQMVFIKDTQRRQVALPEQERSKPGRQIVTFLLICNLAMWIIYTFETQKVEANPVQLEFFGKLSWTILLRCTLPLAIFHRFHSAVVLACIWKNSYKTRLE